jgi:hypothetical protein
MLFIEQSFAFRTQVCRTEVLTTRIDNEPKVKLGHQQWQGRNPEGKTYKGEVEGGQSEVTAPRPRCRYRGLAAARKRKDGRMRLRMARGGKAGRADVIDGS